MAALASEERAARERNRTVRIEKPDNFQMSANGENEGYVVRGELDENIDTTQLQVLAENEVELEVEVPIPLISEDEVTPVKNKYRSSMPESASQQLVNVKGGSYTYSHRAALKARMASLNSTDSGSGSGRGCLRGASAVDTGFSSGSSPAPAPSSPRRQDFSYAAFQSAALQVLLYLLLTVIFLALLVLIHALVFSLPVA